MNTFHLFIVLIAALHCVEATHKLAARLPPVQLYDDRGSDYSRVSGIAPRDADSGSSDADRQLPECTEKRHWFTREYEIKDLKSRWPKGSIFSANAVKDQIKGCAVFGMPKWEYDSERDKIKFKLRKPVSGGCIGRAVK